jgi:hypothetical protein
MKRLYQFSFVIALTFLIGACSLDDDGENFHYEALQIVSAELPEFFTMHQIYTIRVNVMRPDDCTLVEGFDITRAETTTRNVVAVGAILERDDCKSLNQEVQETFQFEVLYSEPYLFRFYTGDDANGDAQFLEIEVPVN